MKVQEYSRAWEFPLRLRGSKPNQYPREWKFDPWSCSMAWGSGIAVSCGVGCRHGLDPELLWQWCRLAATALISPLAWKLLYVTYVALKSKKKKKKKKDSRPFWKRWQWGSETTSLINEPHWGKANYLKNGLGNTSWKKI